MDCDPARSQSPMGRLCHLPRGSSQGLPGCRVRLTALLVPICLCPSAGQQFCVSPQSLQCRGWPRGDTGRLRSRAEHLHPIPKAGSVAWQCRHPREQQPPAAPHLASMGTKHSPQLCAPLSPRFPLLRLVRVTIQVVPPACPQEHRELWLLWFQPKATLHSSTSISVHGAVCCGDRNRGASGKWGSELMGLILAPHPFWKLSQACFGNTAGIFMSGICKGIFILDLETTGPAARFRKRRGKKHETSER